MAEWMKWVIAIPYVALLLCAYFWTKKVLGNRNDNDSTLESFGALFLAPVVAVFLPVIWLVTLWRHAWREAD